MQISVDDKMVMYVVFCFERKRTQQLSDGSDRIILHLVHIMLYRYICGNEIKSVYVMSGCYPFNPIYNPDGRYFVMFLISTSINPVFLLEQVVL